MTKAEKNGTLQMVEYNYWGGFGMSLTMLQVSVFGAFKDIEPNQDRYNKLMSALSGFMPGTTQQVGIDAATGKVQMFQRIQMSNSENGWKIDISLERVNATCIIQTDNSSKPDKSIIANEGLDLIKKCFNALSIDLKLTRFAINAQYIVPTGTNIPSIPFVTSLPTFISDINELSEWTFVLNKNGSVTINENERTNEILSFNIANQTDKPENHARMITVDINTLQNNNIERFLLKDMGSFIVYALSRWDVMISDLQVD